MRQDTLRQGTVDPVDAVDAIVEQWRQERPDLDPSAKEITGRIVRLASLFQQAYGDAFAPAGLNDGDYGVLATLRRAGAPYQLTPTDLARHRMMTSGGMTAAIDRLAHKDLVTRLPNPNDRRGSLVRLTDDGLRIIDEAMERHADVEHELVSSLAAREREQLERLLRKLLISVDRLP
jgi:DNA-binding MarR family transcriptional regulator